MADKLSIKEGCTGAELVLRATGTAVCWGTSILPMDDSAAISGSAETRRTGASTTRGPSGLLALPALAGIREE